MTANTKAIIDQTIWQLDLFPDSADRHISAQLSPDGPTKLMAYYLAA